MLQTELPKTIFRLTFSSTKSISLILGRTASVMEFDYDYMIMRTRW